MVNIVDCKECSQIKYCKLQENFKDEIELILTVQNKFKTALVIVNCHYFTKVLNKPIDENVWGKRHE